MWPVMLETNKNCETSRSRILRFITQSRANLFIVAIATIFSGCAKTDTDLPVTTVVAADPNETAAKHELVKTEPAKTEAINQDAHKKVPTKKNASVQTTDKSANAGPNGKPAEEEPRLMKTNTLLILTYQPDIRATKMVDPMRPFISDEQARKGKRLAFTYDWRFQKILRKRAEILENASDDQNIKAMLLATRVETADLIHEVRARISQEILTPEQRLQVKERYQDD